MSFLTEIWITSSSIFSRGVSLRALISIESSYLYSKYYHATRIFWYLNFCQFLPLLLECCAEIILIISHLYQIVLWSFDLSTGDVKLRNRKQKRARKQKSFERVIFIKRIWKRSYNNTHSLILFLKKLSINYFKHKLKQTFHYFRQESDFFAANTFLFSRHDSTSFTQAPRSMCCSIFATGQFQIAYFFFL